MTQHFKKKERLTSKIEISELFSKGSFFVSYPLKVFLSYNSSASEPLPKVVIAVPKKSFKRAVDRNLIKRRIRESYRIQKHVFIAANKKLSPSVKNMGFIYISKEVSSFQVIESAMNKALLRLIHGS